jgi:hypothetical protein
MDGAIHVFDFGLPDGELITISTMNAGHLPFISSQ